VTNNSGFSSTAIWQQRLEQTGTYTVLCTDGTFSGTNAYTLTLAKFIGANPADEDAATLVGGEIHPASFTRDDIDVFRFPSISGEVVSIVFSNTITLTYPSMFLYGPCGSLLGSTEARSGFERSLVLEGVRLPESGANTLICRDSTASGTNRYSVTLLLEPRLDSMPASTNVVVGSNATFSASVEGTPPFFYQWRKNGVNIAAATNATFTITNVQVTDGGSYSVVVANLFDAVTSDPTVLVVQIISPAPAQEDNFAGRRSLVGTNGVAAGTNVFATREPNEPRHAGKFGSNSVWYTWRAPTTGIATFRTAGSTFDTLLAVYIGTTVDSLTLVASDEDRAGSLNSEAIFNATSNVDYQVAIDGFAGQQGTFALAWSQEQTLDTIPVITAAPVSQTVTQGATATFSVTALGLGLTYQWHSNGAPITGATSDVFALTSAQVQHVGFYAVGITNSAGRGIISLSAALELGSEAGPVSEDKIEDLSSGGETEAPGPGLFGPASPGVPGYLVGAGGIGSHLLSNFIGTTSPNESNHCGVINNATRWIFLTNVSGGSMVIDTRGSSIPTVLGVYTQGPFGHSPLPVACGEPIPADGTGARLARFDAVSNTTYAVVVDGLNLAAGLIQLNWALSPPPLVINQHSFDSGAQAWGLAQSQLTNTFSPTQGNPAGCLMVIAGATNETWYWTAPAEFLANYAAAYGGWLRFDLNDDSSGQPNTTEPLVVMTGAGFTLAYFDFEAPGTNAAGWRRYSVPLHESPSHGEGCWRMEAWGGQFPTDLQMQLTLANLTSLQVRGKAAPGRSGRLDNIAVGTTCAEEPVLSIARLEPTRFVLTWPVNAYCYHLAASDSLSPPAWRTGLPILSQSTNKGLLQAVLAHTNITRFYRLTRRQ